MSYKKPNFTTLTNSTTYRHNPQFIQSHIERIENLLESYDIENSYLSKQVTQLLHEKRRMQTKFALLQQKNSSEQNLKYEMEHHIYDIKKVESNYINQKSASRKYLDQHQKQTNYNNILHQNNKLNIKPQNCKSIAKKTFFQDSFHYSSKDNINNTEQFNKNTNKKQHRIKKLNQNQYKNTYPNINHQDNESPKATSRFVKAQEIKKQNLLQSNINNNKNIAPILKRDAYFQSPENHQCQSVNQSPQKIKNIQSKLIDSILSNTSKKSINELLPTKITIGLKKIKYSDKDTNKKQIHVNQANQKQIQPQKQQKKTIQPKQQSVSYQVSPIKMSESVISPQIKQQLQHCELNSKQNFPDPKLHNSGNVQDLAPKSINTTASKVINIQKIKNQRQQTEQIDQQLLDRHSSIVIGTGINTQFNYHQKPLLNNRSLSQHRLIPSQKISYFQKLQSLKKDSKVKLQKDGKKKFISIVSSNKIKIYQQSNKDKDNSFFK